MRLDPKYFNVFLIICAAITAVVIFVSTLQYASNRQETFIEELEGTELAGWKLYHYESGDSLTTDRFEGSPTVIHFWATWSDLSLELHDLFQQLKADYPDLVVVAGAARDADHLVERYRLDNDYDFEYLNATPLYQDLKVPGIPSQLFVNREGKITGQNVGKDAGAIRREIEKLVETE